MTRWSAELSEKNERCGNGRAPAAASRAPAAAVRRRGQKRRTGHGWYGAPPTPAVLALALLALLAHEASIGDASAVALARSGSEPVSVVWDCDDTTDEIFPTLGDACTEGVGACEAAGALVCTGDGTAVECDAVPASPIAELCRESASHFGARFCVTAGAVFFEPAWLTVDRLVTGPGYAMLAYVAGVQSAHRLADRPQGAPDPDLVGARRAGCGLARESVRGDQVNLIRDELESLTEPHAEVEVWRTEFRLGYAKCAAN